jgi:predicted nucleic acid-binding protein
MLSRVLRVYWDSSVFLAYLEGRETLVCDALFASARKGDIEILTSVLSLTEVALAEEEKRRDHPDPAVDEAIAALWADTRSVKVVEYNVLIAREAQALIREALARAVRLTSREAMHLATGRRMGAEEIHTLDRALLRAGTALGVTISPPRTPQPLLPFDVPREERPL